jgi:hypothetical protein
MRRLLAVVIWMLVVSAAVAQAAPAPAGARDLAVLNGQPHVAVVSASGLLTVDGDTLNHDPSQPAAQPDLIASGGKLWATWIERDADGIWQVRVAKQRNDGHLRELVARARPITLPASLGSSNPRIAVLAAVPYVSYTEHLEDYSTVEVARLTPPPGPRETCACRASFEHITPSGPGPTEPYAGGRITLVGGAIELAIGREDELNVWRLFGSQWVHLAKLDYGISAGDFVNAGSGNVLLAWDGRVHVIAADGTVTALPQDPGVGWGWGALAVVNGVRYAAGVEAARPGDTGELRIAAFRRGAWQPVMVPAEAGDHVDLQSLRLVSGGGTLWILWRDESGAHVVKVA